MQPKSEVKFDKETFKRIKRTIRNMSVGKRNVRDNPSFAMKLPDEVGIQLTNKCNLRCRHCFQWNAEGFHNKLEKIKQNDEISFDIVKKILIQTSETKANLYLWGGEPLCYSEFGNLANELEKDARWTVLCTNGIDVQNKLDSLLKISPNLAILTSVEGFENENDLVRGKGTFKKVMQNIQLLLELKRKGVYKGEVSVNCVISEAMIGKLYDFAEMFETIGINTLYFCFPWYISDKAAADMDIFFKNRFSWLRMLNDGETASWHSYKYSLPPSLAEPLLRDMSRINSRIWKIRMRYQPAVEPGEVEGFLSGDGNTVQGKSKCIGITNRMNVLPDGKITVCKLFPEFEIGDLNTSSVAEIWNSKDFERAREIISCGLMPVCSKCVLLYLHGV